MAFGSLCILKVLSGEALAVLNQKSLEPSYMDKSLNGVRSHHTASSTCAQMV